MSDRAQGLAPLLARIRACNRCLKELPLGPNPTVRADSAARLLIVGQAPGTAVHRTSIPWNDPSGVRLRDWLGLGARQFRDPGLVAIMPAAFCYPGRGVSGDLPPPARCAEAWHAPLLAQMPEVRLKVLVGRYAIDRFLPDNARTTLTDVVRSWQTLLPLGAFPLPHPSPRNNLWLRRNPWFEADVLPALKDAVATAISPAPGSPPGA